MLESTVLTVKALIIVNSGSPALSSLCYVIARVTITSHAVLKGTNPNITLPATSLFQDDQHVAISSRRKVEKQWCDAQAPICVIEWAMPHCVLYTQVPLSTVSNQQTVRNDHDERQSIASLPFYTYNTWVFGKSMAWLKAFHFLVGVVA